MNNWVGRGVEQYGGCLEGWTKGIQFAILRRVDGTGECEEDWYFIKATNFARGHLKQAEKNKNWAKSEYFL